jgi:hypothetical protein
VTVVDVVRKSMLLTQYNAIASIFARRAARGSRGARLNPKLGRKSYLEQVSRKRHKSAEGNSPPIGPKEATAVLVPPREKSVKIGLAIHRMRCLHRFRR